MEQIKMISKTGDLVFYSDSFISITWFLILEYVLGIDGKLINK